MIKHIVMWKLRNSAEEMTEKDNAIRMKQWLEDLKSNIPEIKNLEVSINLHGFDDAYDIVLSSEFKEKASLEFNRNHPTNVRFKEKVKNIRSEKKAVDYEI